MSWENIFCYTPIPQPTCYERPKKWNSTKTSVSYNQRDQCPETRTTRMSLCHRRCTPPRFDMRHTESCWMPQVLSPWCFVIFQATFRYERTERNLMENQSTYVLTLNSLPYNMLKTSVSKDKCPQTACTPLDTVCRKTYSVQRRTSSNLGRPFEKYADS